MTHFEESAVRRALEEAIESVKSTLETFLIEDRSTWTSREHELWVKWNGRVELWQEILTNLGGPFGETSFQEFDKIMED